MVPRREALILAGLAGFLASAQEPTVDDRAPHERLDVPSRLACGPCHARETEEWQRSLHARAWTNANIQAATDGFRKVQCRACHSPMPVLPTGLDEPPDHRDFLQDDGVQCLACHGRADGVAAARDVPDAPCRPRADERLARAELCWPCHEPTHHAFEEYRTSKAFQAGKRCQDCHMEPRADGGHFHGDHGGFNADFVRRALDWSARIEDDALVLELDNLTGHRFPGEISSRSFLIRVTAGDAEPEVLQLRKPHRGEDRADDRLGVDEHRTLRFPLPAGARPVRLELRFLPLPLLPPEQGFLLGEWTGV